jgi:hypothetical protein
MYPIQKLKKTYIAIVYDRTKLNNRYFILLSIEKYIIETIMYRSITKHPKRN